MEGTKKYRFKDNPKEKELHDKFVELFNRDALSKKTLSAIINGWDSDNQHTPNSYLSEKEETICVNIIQWLGSPIGQCFLRDCGFEPKDKKS